MSTSSQFNTKSPTIKRILREAAELSSSPSPDYHAAPLETNLFEWHFTLRGSPSSPYARGLYHGRVVLPPQYPLRPPAFRFLTPSGRFEVNREICLSISGHHEETWQPAWGLRTALVALRAFMETEAKGQVGGLEMGNAARERIAIESRTWRCPGCGGRTNEDIIREQEEMCQREPPDQKEAPVPKELRLGYRDELEKPRPTETSPDHSAEPSQFEPSTSSPSSASRHPESPRGSLQSSPQAPQIPSQPQQNTIVSAAQPVDIVNESVPGWIDKAIVALVVALVVMLFKKFI